MYNPRPFHAVPQSHFTDFLRHAPCMRHVKKDYEVCAVSYQSTMAKIGQTVAHTTVRPPPVQLTTPSAAMALSSSDNVHQQQHHHHRQHQHQHNSGSSSSNNDTKSAEDAEEERLKTVCW